MNKTQNSSVGSNGHMPISDSQKFHTIDLQDRILAVETDGTTSPIYYVSFGEWEKPEVAHPRSRSMSDYISEQKAKGRGPALASARSRISQRRLDDGASPSLRLLRASAGLSQADLADLIGTSQPRIARLEGGTEEPGLKTLRRLAMALNTDINTIDKCF